MMKKTMAMLSAATIAVGAALCAAVELAGGLIAGCASMPKVDNFVMIPCPTLWLS